MNKKAVISIFLLIIFLTPMFSLPSLVMGETASDQLKVVAGSYVKGRYYAEQNNETLAHVTITVKKVWNITSSKNVVAIEKRYDYPAGAKNEFFSDSFSTIIMTELIWEHNRTVIYPAARLYLVNSTDSIDMSMLSYNTYDKITNVTNLVITFKDGSSYVYNEVSSSDSVYSKIMLYTFIWSIINVLLSVGYTYTNLAINPDTTDSMTVNYRNGTANVEDMTSFKIGDKKFDTIHLHQAKALVTSGIISAKFNEIDAYYENKNGLLVKWKETDYDTGKVKIFEPSEINIKTKGLLGSIDFPYMGVIIAITIIALPVIIMKRKR